MKKDRNFRAGAWSGRLAAAAIAAGLLASTAPALAAQQSRARSVRPPLGAQDPSAGAPTLTNEMLAPAPPPLPPTWPRAARDAGLYGASCEVDVEPAAARAKGEPSDVVLPVFERVASEAIPPPLLAVRRRPFLARGDVIAATYVEAPGGRGYDVHLHLSDEGSAKAQAYTAENVGRCIALVAGGKVLWSPTLESAVTGSSFVLSGGFDISEADAIVGLFAEP